VPRGQQRARDEIVLRDHLLHMIDEIDLHIAPMLLSDRLYDNPGSEPIRLHRVGESDATSAVNVRYRPTATAKDPDRENVGQLSDSGWCNATPSRWRAAPAVTPTRGPIRGDPVRWSAT